MQKLVIKKRGREENLKEKKSGKQITSAKPRQSEVVRIDKSKARVFIFPHLACESQIAKGQEAYDY